MNDKLELEAHGSVLSAIAAHATKAETLVSEGRFTESEQLAGVIATLTESAAHLSGAELDRIEVEQGDE